MIVAMVTPISLALVFNIMCLTKNIFAIRRLQKVISIIKRIEARIASHQPVRWTVLYVRTVPH